MKNRKIEIPDYNNIEILEDEDLIKLGDSLLEALKQKIGTTKLYVVSKWSNSNGYEVTECSVDDISFSRESYNSRTNLNFKRVYGEICYIYKDKEKAQKYCDKQNVDFIKKQIEQIKKDIDECNPVIAMENAEKKKKDLLVKYNNLKEKLNKIEEKAE